MKVLALESSSLRGSAALCSDGQVHAYAAHEQPQGHSQVLLPLVESLFLETGWAKSSLDKVAVGTGPGSFTGLRVGIALAQGIAQGLQIDVVGVSSLAAMARAVELRGEELCCAILDARREELFVGIYDAERRVHERPRVLACTELRGVLGALGRPCVAVGKAVDDLGLRLPDAVRYHRSLGSDLPCASQIGLLAAQLPVSPAEPEYLRGANARLPALPPSPLG